MSETLERKTDSRRKVYGIVRFLTWLGTCIGIYFLLVLLQDIISGLGILNRDSADMISQIIYRLMDFWPKWILVGLFATMRTVMNIATIKGTIKFTIEWFFFCILMITLFDIVHEITFGLIGGTPFGRLIARSVEGGLFGALIGYGIWWEQKRGTNTIQQVSDLFVPINREGARYIRWWVLSGASVAAALVLLFVGDVSAVMLAVVMVAIIGVSLRAFILIRRPIVRTDSKKIRSTITTAIIVICGLSAVGLFYADLAWRAIGLVLLAIAIAAGALVTELNSTQSESGGYDVNKQ